VPKEKEEEERGVRVEVVGGGERLCLARRGRNGDVVGVQELLHMAASQELKCRRV
jgi:hypothetical protein